jgi:hypothetical protein
MRLDGGNAYFWLPIIQHRVSGIYNRIFAASGKNVNRKMHQKQVVNRHDDAFNAARVKVPRYPY